MSGYFPAVKIDRITRKHMLGIAEPLSTTAGKIRALAAAGYRISAIATFLGIRYQHVYNVLKRPFQAASPARTRTRGLAESETAAPGDWLAGEPDEPPTYGSFALDEQGRITLPRNVIRALDGEPRRRIPWRFENGELILMNQAAGVRSAQAMVADLAREHPGSWSDELIAERRAEAAREDERDAARRRK